MSANQRPPGDSSGRSGAEAADSPKAVVGVGASTGGLDAFTRLLGALPPDTGFAFVLVQHLDAHHASSLGELLGRATTMPVVEAVDGLPLRRDTVVVIPSNAVLTVAGGACRLDARASSALPSPTVDVLLRSIAQEYEGRGIGVVLSGTGADGAEGLVAIREAGGITFAQDPATAEAQGMPTMAAAVGGVDFVLSPDAIARELARLSRDPRFGGLVAEEGKGARSAPSAVTPAQRTALFDLMHEATGIDFSLYREATVDRRLRRRMAIRDITDVDQYTRLLQKDGDERAAFLRDLLIGVTHFFREPESFEALQRLVFPALVRDRPADAPIRIWVPGCSTGEEAYSILIALREFLDGAGGPWPVQLFATDISDAAIEQARAGVYPDSIAADVDAARLARFFTKVEGGYRIDDKIREQCVFSRHNLLDDPPFSRLDLISCRNVLIYLEAVRRSILPLFHYALRDGGFLMLGRSESARFPELFRAVEGKLRIYSRLPGAARPARLLRWSSAVRLRPDSDRSVMREKLTALSMPGDLAREADRTLLAKYSPTAVLLGPALEVLEIRGHAAPFLRLPSGALSFHLSKLLVDAGLFLEVEAMVDECARSGQPVRKAGLLYATGGGVRDVAVEVVPLESRGSRGHLVLFEPAIPEPGAVAAPAAGRDAAGQERTAQLERDLQAARERVLAVAGEFEMAEQESQRMLEDALSANEELQSLTEELETAKEELRSTNEELVTLNAELEKKNAAIAAAQRLASAVVDTVDLPLLVLDGQMKVRSANPAFVRAYGMDTRAAVGKDLFRAWGGAWDFPELHAALHTILPDDRSFGRIEAVREFPELGTRTVVVSGRRLLDHDLILLTVEDVTERRRAETDLRDSEERREQAEKMEIVGRLAGGIAHEFNNLLTVVLGHCDLLLARMRDEGLAAAHVTPIRKSAERAAMLTDQLLAFSRRKVVQPRVIDLNAVVAEFERMLRRLLGEHFDVVVRTEPALWKVRADAGELGRVVMNLALNARDAMPVGGVLTISTSNRELSAATEGPGGLAPGRYVCLTVQDDGVGMDADTRSRIFEPFFSTKGNGMGTGLGLSTVKAIAEQSGGDVRCFSQVGVGTQMHVLLPALPEEAAVPPPGIAEAPRGKQETVLLVEDDDSVRGVTRQILEETGYEVLDAPGGAEALDLLSRRSGPVDLLLTDVVMPGVGGRELAERALTLRPGLKVLFISGHTEDVLLKQGVLRGAAFLHKPFVPVQLAEKVRETLAAR